MKYQADKLKEQFNGWPTTENEVKHWEMARPMEWQGLPKYYYRIKESWLVLKGEADILVWGRQKRKIPTNYAPLAFLIVAILLTIMAIDTVTNN